MKKSIMVLLCFFSLSVFAQEKTDKSKWARFMPMMTKSAGISFQKFDGLNNRIAGFPQYKTVPDHTWTISGGSMHVIKNFVSQMTIMAGSSLTGRRNEQSSTIRTFGGGIDFGYDVIPADMIMVYPLAGIGAETYHAIFYKDVSGVDFDDVADFPGVQNSIRSVKFVNSFVTYRLGLGIALKSPKYRSTIGLQAGYAGSFHDESWKSSEYQSLDNSPSDHLQRFFVSLVLTGDGMMGMMKK